jgi:uncharacterized delta-60 repeat protein
MNRIYLKIIFICVFSNFSARAQQGYLDTTFGTNGIATLAESVIPSTMCIQQDGKILVAGSIQDGDLLDYFICRYHPDGALDESFGNNGKIEISEGTRALKGIVEMPDGRIVALGPNFDFMRFSNSGVLDTALGENGFLTYNFGTTGGAMKMRLLADGKLLATGNRSYVPATPHSGTHRAILAKFNSDLTLDTSFSDGGYYVSPVRECPSLNHFDVSDDGSIVALIGSAQGGSMSNVYLMKFLADGEPDTSFGTESVKMINLGSLYDMAYDVKILEAGKILFSGTKGDPRDMVLGRTNQDGTLDDTYASSGIFTFTSPTVNGDLALASWPLNDGRIVTVMRRAYDDLVDFRLLFTDGNGAIDTTAGEDGFVITPLIAKNLTCAIRQPDGKIIAAGYDANGLVMVRYNTEATLESDSFNALDFNAYPNPTTDSVTITNLPDATPIVLYSVSGQKLLETTAAAGGTTPIDVSGLGKGIYILNTAKGSAKIIKK